MPIKKILVICPYPIGMAPSQRFRIELFISDPADTITFELRSFWTEKSFSILYKKGYHLQKAVALKWGFLRRLFHVFQSVKYDYVLIHREMAPIGPPIFEWMLAKIFRKKIIFDFDDSIWLENTSKSNRIASFLKWPKKFESICRWSYKISAGNSYLAEKALLFNSNVEIIPTVVDTENYHNADLHEKRNHQLTIGWTGTHSTIPYLTEIIPIIKKLEDRFELRFLLISDTNPELSLCSFEFRKWSKEKEIEDLMEIDIGIMPLTIDKWSRGKCGFKIIQYLALGIPSIATRLAPNDKIISDSQNGFLCESIDEWERALITLLENQKLRESQGRAGRAHIEKYYSKQSQFNSFLGLFQ